MTKESYADGKPDCEYFCTECLQLRLSYLIRTYKCSNCDSKNIIKGKPGSLDKTQLKKQYQSI
jgi:DNA-directed RNA polymerase subunit RPC12/RpoP